MVGTTYSSFGQETVITYNFFSFDTITELFYFGGSRDDTMQEQKGKGNAFIFGFPVSTGTVYIDRYTEKRIVKGTKMFKMFFSVPSSNINNLLNLIHLNTLFIGLWHINDRSILNYQAVAFSNIYNWL